ncbi:MarR family winged helix-turn-helix transcriptional regulator [Solwaraspora sp. WMMB335]|uniref:MarR family winged helix-turn-helix transcriptional regulator n=1 Tax=Solwaraspora sp. WMMB335 TaxID=3404118 RepID=UPI003B94C0EB
MAQHEPVGPPDSDETTGQADSDETVGPVDDAVGYVLKQAAVALRTAMDAALRPMRLTVPQYACLELLGQRPNLSNAELARGAFVTRQSMNVVLRGLEERGLVTRPATAPHGRELPAALTDAGRDQLRTASAAVRRVEKQMCAGLSPARQQELLEGLTTCVGNLTGPT